MTSETTGVKHTKKCSTCGETDFAKLSLGNTSDTRRNICKACKTKKEKIRYETDMRARASSLIASARFRAKKAGLPMTLEVDEIAEVLRKGKCELTGMPFVFKSSEIYHVHPSSPTLDRVESNKGYTPENTMVVCFLVNALMGQYPPHLVRPFAKAYLKATEGKKS